VYGFVEGSKTFGFFASFFCQPLWNAMYAKLTPKWTIIIMIGVQSAMCAASGLADYYDNNTIFVVISIVARVGYGFFSFPKNVGYLDILKKIFPEKFDFLSGLTQMAYFLGGCFSLFDYVFPMS